MANKNSNLENRNFESWKHKISDTTNDILLDNPM